MTYSKILTTVMISILFTGSGCGDGRAPEDETNLGPESKFGLVLVNYAHDWNDSGEALLLNTTAQFVHYTSLNQDQVARLLALPLNPDRDLPALDACKIYDLSVELGGDESFEAHEPGNVDLLEAGELSVQTADRTVVLEPRHFSGLLPFISGVVYGEAEASEAQLAGKVRASSVGGEAVGSFTAETNSPSLPRLRTIDHRAPVQPLLINNHLPLTINWNTALETTTLAQSTDALYLEIRFSRERRDMALRCRPQDNGQFTVPAAAMSEVNNGKATLELARLRRGNFSATGLEQGELRVTLRDTAAIQIQ